MPCGGGWGFLPKQGLLTLPRFPQPLSAPAGSRVTRPLLRGKMVLNWYTCSASFGARWYRIDVLAVNILWLYYVDISLSYFSIEFALWANNLSAIWLFVFCSQMNKYHNAEFLWCASAGLRAFTYSSLATGATRCTGVHLCFHHNTLSAQSAKIMFRYDNTRRCLTKRSTYLCRPVCNSYQAVII